MPLIPSRCWLYFTCAVLIGSSHQGLLQAYRIPMDFLTFPPIFLLAFPCYLFQTTRLSRSGIKMPDFRGKVTGIRIRGLTTFFFFFFADKLPSKLITLRIQFTMYVTFIYLSAHFFSISQIYYMHVFQPTFVPVCVCVCARTCACVCTAQGARGWSNMFSYPGK